MVAMKPSFAEARFGRSRFGRGFTLMEVMLALALLLILLFAIYRYFFAEIRSIRSALEHIEVNENARLFLARFGNDVRNSVWLEYPPATVREGVPKLLPALEGEFCVLNGQVFDFSLKPPDAGVLKKIRIAYRLKKNKFGSYEIHRDVESEAPPTPGGPAPYKGTRMVCDGVKEIFVYSSIKRPVKMSSFAGALKPSLIYEPYELDGHGPYLVHVRVSFVRPNRPVNEQENALALRTCFAIRGRPSWVNP